MAGAGAVVVICCCVWCRQAAREGTNREPRASIDVANLANVTTDFAVIVSSLLTTLRRLHDVCLRMDLERQDDRPTEEEYQDAMRAAAAVIAKQEER